MHLTHGSVFLIISPILLITCKHFSTETISPIIFHYAMMTTTNTNNNSPERFSLSIHLAATFILGNSPKHHIKDQLCQKGKENCKGF